MREAESELILIDLFHLLDQILRDAQIKEN
jgi:hypothetical protein